MMARSAANRNHSHQCSTMDLDRAMFRGDSMKIYAIITSLILGSCIGILSLNASLSLEEKGSIFHEAVEVILLILQGIAIIASAYTTVIFTLMALYHATALGMGGDECLMEFEDKAKGHRMRAFQTFMISIYSLMLSFIPFSYLYAGSSTHGMIVLVCVATLVFLAFRDFWKVIAIAKTAIFDPMTNKDMYEKARRRVSIVLSDAYEDTGGFINGKRELLENDGIA
mmetsp:Transcript_26019/g.38452  ORF Transcript_26019/g.38452 Transcript_26019/m.38452 type:complete len:226 (+) Transcript_26019:32-709(+)